MSGPAWYKTLLVWTYDEHGGYYDHVRPPQGDRAGRHRSKGAEGPVQVRGIHPLRVPGPDRGRLPWARPNYVSHQVFDHASICALVEAKWNLPAMTFRDANANAMLDMLDLNKPAFDKPPGPGQAAADHPPVQGRQVRQGRPRPDPAPRLNHQALPSRDRPTRTDDTAALGDDHARPDRLRPAGSYRPTA